MRRRYKCKICGREFELKKENQYTVDPSSNLFGGMFGPPILHECFDCPYCGCQNKVNQRLTGRTQEGEKSNVEN